MVIFDLLHFSELFLTVILGFKKSTVCKAKVFVRSVESYGHFGYDHGKRAPIRELRTGRTQFPIDTERLHGKLNDHRCKHGFGPNQLNTAQLVLVPRKDAL
jgi:hypothetical protein